MQICSILRSLTYFLIKIYNKSIAIELYDTWVNSCLFFRKDIFVTRIYNYFTYNKL